MSMDDLVSTIHIRAVPVVVGCVDAVLYVVIGMLKTY